MALETERKYLCKMPELSALKNLPSFCESDILQVYLRVGDVSTHRIRARQTNGVTVYTETVKKRVSHMTCQEDEHEIDALTFTALMQKRDPSLSVLEKKRITFVYEGQLFEVDIYPFYDKICVVETELRSENESASFPPELSVIREVTGDFRFSNAALTREIPSEESLLP